MKSRILTALSLTLISSVAFSTELSLPASPTAIAGTQIVSAMKRLAAPQSSTATPIHGNEQFLGCVGGNHQCYHLAQRAGFFHYYIQHDHGVCPYSPGFACFGYND